MLPSLYAAALALLCGAVSWALVRWRGARWRWLPWVVPPLFYFGVQFGVMWLALEIATCTGEDCGQSIFAAAVLVSAVAAFVGLFGSIVGSILGARRRG